MKPVDETSLATMVYDDWIAGRQRMRTLIEKCKEWDRQWDGIMPPKDFPWKNCSNLNVPITSSIGDTLLATLVQALLGQRPLLKVKPRGDTPARNARIMEAVIDDQAYSDSNLFSALVEAFHDGLRYGVWAVIVDWEDYTVHVPVRVAMPTLDSDSDTVLFEEDTIIRTKHISRPRIMPQNISEIVVSPGATCINNDGVGIPADYVIFRRFFKMEELQRNAEGNGGSYFNLEKLTPSSRIHDADEILREKEERLGVDQPELCSYDFEGLEGWYWYDIDGDGTRELCIFTVVISDDKPVLIRKQECPYMHYKIPLVWQKLFPERGLYSRSVPGWLKDIQDELNTIHNQRRDAVSLSLLKMWKYRLGSRFDVNQELFPGCMIGVMDMEDFAPIVTYEHGIVPAISEEDLLNQYVQKMTGITDYAMGQESDLNSRPSASGTIALIQNSNLRIDLIAKYWRSGGLRELGELLGELNKQFYPVENKLEPFDMSVFGEDDLDQGMLRVLLSDLYGDFKYEYIGNHYLIDKNAEREQAVFLYELLQNNAIIQQSQKTLYDLTQDILHTFGKHDIRLPSPAQIEHEQIETLKQAIKEASVENRISYIDTLKNQISELEQVLREKQSTPSEAHKPSSKNQHSRKKKR